MDRRTTKVGSKCLVAFLATMIFQPRNAQELGEWERVAKATCSARAPNDLGYIAYAFCEMETARCDFACSIDDRGREVRDKINLFVGQDIYDRLNLRARGTGSFGNVNYSAFTCTKRRSTTLFPTYWSGNSDVDCRPRN